MIENIHCCPSRKGRTLKPEHTKFLWGKDKGSFSLKDNTILNGFETLLIPVNSGKKCKNQRKKNQKSDNVVKSINYIFKKPHRKQKSHPKSTFDIK